MVFSAVELANAAEIAICLYSQEFPWQELCLRPFSATEEVQLI